jgi:hypothetical protein
VAQLKREDDRDVELEEDQDQWWEDDIRDTLEGYKGEPTEDDIKSLREWLDEFRKLSEGVAE